MNYVDQVVSRLNLKESDLVAKFQSKFGTEVNTLISDAEMEKKNVEYINAKAVAKAEAAVVIAEEAKGEVLFTFDKGDLALTSQSNTVQFKIAELKDAALEVERAKEKLKEIKEASENEIAKLDATIEEYKSWLAIVE